MAGRKKIKLVAIIDSELVARQESAHYEMLWQTATRAQRVLLIALAGDPEALPFPKDFQTRHGIGPSSSIKASLVSLEKIGSIYRTLEGRYHFVDRFIPCWIDDIRISPNKRR